MSAPTKSFANSLGTDLIKLLRLYLAGERMSRTGKVYQGLGADIQHISSVGAGSIGRGVLFWYAKIRPSVKSRADGAYCDAVTNRI